MMDCEWTNPGAAMLLSSTDDAHIIDQHILRQPVFPLYDLPSMFSPFPSQASPLDDYSLNRYGGATGGGAATVPAAGQPMRIGLNLGVRTYFSSTPDGELMRLGSNIYRRCGGGTAATPGGVFSAMPSDGGRCGSAARCQAEGCAADLSRAKHYHRRHKVCEFHSKAASSLVHGLTQRFCQQCSRFHVVAEFDQGKRSCRKRLAEHNRRRRKTHHVATAKSSTEVAPPGKYGGALAAPPSPTRMALGRYAGANSATSSSLSQLGGASSCVSQGPHLDLGRRSLA